MSARIPLDVDLEDRLLYGLTPTHLAYMVVALLAGFAVWSSHLASTPVRGVACFLLIGVGAVVAWGRWRGRAVDAWMVDVLLFAVRSRRIVWNRRFLRPLKVARSKQALGPDEPFAATEPESAVVAAAA